MEKLSFTMENYLEAVYELSGEGTGARVSDIADRLSVTRPSTNSAMTTLAERGLVSYEKYGEIFLTPEGRKLAESTADKHHTIRAFFTEVLDLDFETADADACAIEHVISGKSVRAMQEFMRAGEGPGRKGNARNL